MCNTDIFVFLCNPEIFVCYCVILTYSKASVRCNVWGPEDVNINVKTFCIETSCGFVDRSHFLGGRCYCFYCAQDEDTAYLRPVSQNVRHHVLRLLREERVKTILLNSAIRLSENIATDPLSALRKRRRLCLPKHRHMHVAIHSALSLKKLRLFRWNLSRSVRLC